MLNSIFLVGGPGSGKNILLDTIKKYNFKEITLDSINSNLDKLTENYIINCNAYAYDKIIETNNILLDNNYNTSMIFVDVNENTVKNRTFGRLISEDIYQKKYIQSKENLYKFYDLFENFIRYDNNNDLSEQDFSDVEKFIIEVLSLSNIKAFVKKLKAKGENIRPSKINYRSSNTTRSKLNKTVQPDEDLINNVKQSIKVSENAEPSVSNVSMIGVEGGGFKQEEPIQSKSYSCKPTRKTWKRAKKILFKG
jgi:hypothetical protein